jgi:class 3 adenylate cyclase/tetratricopeptide (TPR) repeat protein
MESGPPLEGRLEEIVSQDRAFEEEVQEGMLAFLLTDIEGSTRLWQSARPQMRQAIKRHDELLHGCIETSRGRVLKERGEGDSFFAVFRSAVDAIGAAAEIQRALASELWPERVAIRVRIAVSVGEADREQRGTAVNRCARLRALAAGGQVLVSQSTQLVVRDELPEDLALIDLGERLLRDFGVPERIYQLTIAKALVAVDPLLTAEQHKLDPGALPITRPTRRALCPILVGRSRELLLLEDALNESASGRLVLLAGEAGMGKTRLADEILQRADKAGRQVMWGACSEAELAIPYLPVVEAVGNYLGSADLTAMTQRLGPMARELGHLFPQFAAENSVLDRSDLGQARLRLFESILAVLRVAAEPNGLLLVIEDIHWADASTRELLDYLARRLSNSQTTVLLTYRQDELPRGHPLLVHLQAWERLGIATKLELSPLTPKDVASMVSAMFNQEPVTSDFQEFIHARAEGNPFVLEEMLKTARDGSGPLAADFQWDREAIAGLRIPTTVREVIVQRVSRLKDQLVDIVRMAAVLGETFSYHALTAACGLPDRTVSAALRECVQQQLMESEGPHRFRFRHALTREAVYEDLLAPERVEAHSRAATALRQIGGTQAAEIANHLVLAEKWDEAVPTLIHAAEEAENGRGYHEAASLYGHALPHVGDPVLRARLACRQAQAYYFMGAPAHAKPQLEKAIPVLEQAGLVEEAATYRLTLGWCHMVAGHSELARAQYETIRISLEDAGPSELLAHAYSRLALIDLRDLESEKGLEMAEQAIRAAEAAGAEAPRLWGYMYRGCALATLGSLEAGLLDVDRSWREALELGLTDIAGSGLSNAVASRTDGFRASENGPLLDLLKTTGGRLASWVHYRKVWSDITLGKMSDAYSAGSEGLRLAQEESAQMLIPAIQSWLAVSECGLGRTEEARGRVKHVSLDVGRDLSRYEEALAIMRVCLDIGELDRALQTASGVLSSLERASRLLVWDVWLTDKAVEVFLAGRMPGQAERLSLLTDKAPRVMQPLIDRINGRMALYRGDLIGAEKHLLAAADFFHDHSNRDDEWRTRRVLADVKVRRKDFSGAAHELESVLSGAEALGHVFEATAARRGLADMASEPARPLPEQS